MNEKSQGQAASAVADVEELSNNLNEIRRQLSAEVKTRRDIIKPIENALRALKDPHNNAVALYEAGVTLSQPPADFELPRGAAKLFTQVNALADAHLSELEFTFARDLRAAFKERGIKLAGEPAALIADLFIIKPDLRRKQVEITFSRQPVTGKKIKLDVTQVVSAYERARRDICERKIDYDELLQEIFQAYERTLKLAGKGMGTRMGIVDCYRELVLVQQPLAFRRTPSKNSFKDYPKSHFAYDMLQLRRLSKLNYDKWRLNLGVATIDVGNDSTRAMFLATGATEGQFIKDLYFTDK
ncbi:MAG: hypothetical protein M3430_22205 [Acidobacteriota bacterium]|nr:hypothetical protein [Acidobacteriota bacterium]